MEKIDKIIPFILLIFSSLLAIFSLLLPVYAGPSSPFFCLFMPSSPI